jgi:hypothetical protein
MRRRRHRQRRHPATADRQAGWVASAGTGTCARTCSRGEQAQNYQGLPTAATSSGGTPAAAIEVVSTQHHVSAAVLATDPARTIAEPNDGGARKDRGPPTQRPAGAVGDRTIGRLASLVTHVVECLDAPADALLYDAVARCNAALETYLEAAREREAREREDPAAVARDELVRLTQLLMAADRADAALVMRQIRRVLGRFDGPDLAEV